MLPPLPAVDTPSYELVANGGPLVVLLAMSADESIYGRTMGSLPADLIGAGFSLLSLDLPCHAPGEDSGVALECWRERIEAGDRDLFLRFCSGLSDVLDALGETDVSIVGQSRGGYVAITCAAYDGRIRRAALLMPVTDLSRLTEFDGLAVHRDFSVAQYVSYLTGRPALVRIGLTDARVGTDAAVAFAGAVGAELQLLDVTGHNVPEDGATTRWLLNLVSS